MSNFYHDISRGVVAGTITGIIVFLAPRVLSRITFLTDDLQLAWVICILGYIVFRIFMWMEHIRNALVQYNAYHSGQREERPQSFCPPSKFFYEDAVVFTFFFIILQLI